MREDLKDFLTTAYSAAEIIIPEWSNVKTIRAAIDREIKAGSLPLRSTVRDGKVYIVRK